MKFKGHDHRHCERSVAIHKSSTTWIARAPLAKIRAPQGK